MTRNELTKLWAKVTGKFNALIGGAPEALDTLKEIADKLGDDDDALAGLLTQVAGKQDALVSGQNIKTVNGQSVLGSGNLELGELFVVRMTRNNSNSVYTADKSVSEIYTASYTNGKPVIAVMRDINNPVFILSDCDPDGDSYVFSAIESNTVTTLRWKRTDDYTYELETIALQPHLVSGTSIKTVNNESLLGGGNVDIVGKSAYQSYVDTTADSPVKTEAEWVASLKGEDGVSLGEVAVADNLTTDDGTKVLSARQGYLLGQKVNVVDDVPTAGSEKFVKSGGVWNAIPGSKNNIPSKLFVCDANGNVVLDLSNGFVKTKNFDSTKIPEEIERLLQIIAENYEKIEEVENKINLKISDEFGSIRLFVKDENGNVLLELYDGVIKTKNFNSNVLPTINTNNNNEFNICDCFGNVLLAIKNGNIISKKFNSNDVNTLALRVSEIERKSDGYDSLIARSMPAISWIDDDFDTYSVERLGKLNTLKSWAIENNIKPDIALIPDVTYTDAQRTDIESVYFNNERLALAMEFEYSGLHMLTHPIHYGIYGDVIKDDHYIRKDLFLSRKALLDAGFPGCDIFVYAGSSAGVADVFEAAKAYYDVAIMPGGNATNVNLPTKQNRFRLVRFSLDDISATNTVSQIKQQIDECIATKGWIIFITHVWMHTGDGTEPVDETSNSLSNVFNIIQYANQKVQIRPTQEVWKEKKILWEYYK